VKGPLNSVVLVSASLSVNTAEALLVQVSRLDRRSPCPERELWQNGWVDLDAVGVVSGVGQGMGVVIVEGKGAVLGMNLRSLIVTNGDILS